MRVSGGSLCRQELGRASPPWPWKRAGPWSPPTGPRCHRPPKPSASRRPSPITPSPQPPPGRPPRRSTRALQSVAASNTDGKRWPASDRARNAATSWSRSAQIPEDHTFGGATVGAKRADQAVVLAGAQRRAGRPASPPQPAPGRPGGAAPAGWGRTTRPATWDAQAPDPQPSCSTGGVGARCAAPAAHSPCAQ
jgi:hypothetical protein